MDGDQDEELIPTFHHVYRKSTSGIIVPQGMNRAILKCQGGGGGGGGGSLASTHGASGGGAGAAGSYKQSKIFVTPGHTLDVFVGGGGGAGGQIDMPQLDALSIFAYGAGGGGGGGGASFVHYNHQCIEECTAPGGGGGGGAAAAGLDPRVHAAGGGAGGNGGTVSAHNKFGYGSGGGAGAPVLVSDFKPGTAIILSITEEHPNYMISGAGGGGGGSSGFGQNAKQQYAGLGSEVELNAGGAILYDKLNSDHAQVDESSAQVSKHGCPRRGEGARGAGGWGTCDTSTLYFNMTIGGDGGANHSQLTDETTGGSGGCGPSVAHTNLVDKNLSKSVVLSGGGHGGQGAVGGGGGGGGARANAFLLKMMCEYEQRALYESTTNCFESRYPHLVDQELENHSSHAMFALGGSAGSSAHPNAHHGSSGNSGDQRYGKYGWGGNGGAFNSFETNTNGSPSQLDRNNLVNGGGGGGGGGAPINGSNPTCSSDGAGGCGGSGNAIHLRPQRGSNGFVSITFSP
jgi:hypothetical protein